jgi:hypothetical protein
MQTYRFPKAKAYPNTSSYSFCVFIFCDTSILKNGCMRRRKKHN